jgi:hypothetical protein
MKTTKRELRQLIKQIIQEQSVSQSYQKGVGTGTAQGQATKQAITGQINELSRIGKEYLIKFAGLAWKVVTVSIGGALVTYWVIRDVAYKINNTVHTELIKFFKASYNMTVDAAQAVMAGTINAFKAAQIYTMEQYQNAKDQTAAVCKFAIDLGSRLGKATYAQILAGISTISAINNYVSAWLGQQWTTVQNTVKMTWDEAKKQGQNLYNYLKSGAKSAANYGANLVGQASGFVQGLMEIFERYLSFTSNTVSGVLREARDINFTIL